MKPYQRRIEDAVSIILKNYKISKAPVAVTTLAKKMGLTIKPYDLGENVSGVLVVEQNSGIIGINPSDPQVRQRFTIAHELGHYELHRNKEDFFIDKQKILFRDANSSSGEIKNEREANAFAAAILMPENLLRKEINKKHINVSEEEAVKKLAKTFGVSEIAMTFRITNLNLI
jgi:Zn-dependent peptidase ImmA (M78 family)